MSGFGVTNPFVQAFIAIVLLTWVLVVMNVRSEVRRYDKVRNGIRLYSYLAVLVFLGSSIILVSSAVLQRVMDIQTYLLTDTTPVVPYHRR